MLFALPQLKFTSFALALLSSTAFLPMTAMAADNTPPSDAEARQLAKEFLGQLKPALMAAMKSGGPTKAIEVCHTKAPQIAKDLSEKSGWDITRVSTKPRGANATPDDWEKMVLASFEARKAAGQNPKTIEYSANVNENGETYYRYMKAIPTGKVCLTCHGTKISPALQTKLDNYYPKDTATGYHLGDIRGAFSFKKAVSTTQP